MSANTVRNEQIKSLFIQRFSYEMIGSLFNLSKTRTFQIVTASQSKKYDREKIKVDFLKYNKSCNLCGGNSIIKLHFIDGNTQNVDRDNILPLCEGCYELFNKD